MPSLKPQHQHLLQDSLHRLGQRSTRQREQVFGVLMAKFDHPTAEEVFQRSREVSKAISLATVYNCLEIFVAAGLVRTVNFERQPTRYCPNLHEHAHLYDERTGEVVDLDLPEDLSNDLRAVLPEGYEDAEIELNFRGQSATTSEDKTS